MSWHLTPTALLRKIPVFLHPANWPRIIWCGCACSKSIPPADTRLSARDCGYGTWPP